MTDQANPRPMTADDYAAVRPLHPTRDLIVGAVIGAAALWLVPRVLDHFAGGWLAPQLDEYEL